MWLAEGKEKKQDFKQSGTGGTSNKNLKWNSGWEKEEILSGSKLARLETN